MKTLTIFSVPKPFRDNIKVIQINAIRSWMMLRPACEIILMGNEEGTAEIASELGLRHIPIIVCNEYGTPLVSSIFNIAQDTAMHNILCYINADIILMSDFIAAVQSIPEEPFLMIGQRWDLGIEESIDFNNSDWESRLRIRLAEHGKLHPITGIDYFVFSHGLYTEVPPFALGRTYWDNWLIYHACSLRIPVIDATKMVTIIHQDHGYTHYPGGIHGIKQGPERKKNLELMGSRERSFCTKHANWILTPRGLKRAWTPGSIYYWLDAAPVLHPNLRFLNIPKKIIFGISRSIRSIIGKPSE